MLYQNKYRKSIGEEEHILTARPLTLFEKVWNRHVIVEREDGACLLWIDRHFVHEGSFHGFDAMRARGGRVARPDLTFGIADHYVPTRGGEAGITDPEIARMITQLRGNARAHGLRHFDLEDPGQGIVHVVGPEQGLILPGTTVVCGDSHTTTNGAFGAIAFGIGASEVAHVLMTQTLWQRPPARMRIIAEGRLAPGVSAKDLALHVIARVGSNGATGHAVEYAGSAVEALTMEGRMTLCNMTIEAGARSGMVAPDATTLAFLRGRPHAPDVDAVAGEWLALASDPGAVFDRELRVDAGAVAPTVTWGTAPEEAAAIDGRVPHPDDSPGRAAHLRQVLDYMGLMPGMRLSDIEVDLVFIGSCTNSRIEDLRAAAAVLAGRKARVPGLVSPGSAQVKAQAEAEGLDRVFIEAGLEWADSGCSMCVAMNGDRVAPGQRCASTTNRNFRGRQGAGARTHLMSPAMVAAAAVTGRLTDVRSLEPRG